MVEINFRIESLLSGLAAKLSAKILSGNRDAMRLSNKTIAAANAVKPNYDRTIIKPGIMHIGVGAFHRAHQAVYIDGLLLDQPEWGIIGASLRNADMANALNPQGGAYTLCVNGSERSEYRIIGSILGVVDASTNTEELLEKLVDPATRIVSLTVTEKGYCLDPSTGQLNTKNAEILADLASPSAPRSVPGILVEALRRRKNSDVKAFTVLSCDNLPSNGKTTRAAVVEMARLQDSDLASWIDQNASFPNSMVDRITPAATPEDRIQIAGHTGLEDAAPVITEPFSQWVIEDDFCNGRPKFENAGATMVADVEAFENMKLRMLNGSHSTLAYLGYLKGHQTIADAIGDPELLKLVTDLMTEEVIPILDMPEDIDLYAYRDALISRFQNKSLKHRTWQIAMDGSQKLPQRLLDSARERIHAGEPYQHLAQGIAGWMRYATGIDLNGDPIDVRDPMRDQLGQIGQAYLDNPDELVGHFLAIESIFGTDLSKDQEFRKTIVKAYKDRFA